MSIASEFQSTAENIQADYEGLENIGADLTGINKNILNIRTILDTIYNDMPKVTGEGTEVTLTPTRKGRLAITPKGNSTQESTTGKNLFNIADLNASGIISNKTSSTSGTSFTITRTVGRFSNTIELASTIQSGTTIYISATLSNNTLTKGILMQFGTTNQYTTQQAREINNSITLTSDMKYFRLFLDSTETSGNSAVVSNLQIEIGSSATSWEQYTGGNPAPNPSYPFPIKSVTGNNNVVVINQLFNATLEQGTISTDNGQGSNSTTRLRTQDYITLEPDTTYYIICSDMTNFYDRVFFYQEDNTYISSSMNFVIWNNTFTTPNNCKKAKFIFRNSANTTIQTTDITGIVLYKNSQTLPLNLGTIELNKIGNYQDYIYKTSGKNKFSSVMELGSINNSTGNPDPNDSCIRTKDFILVQPNTQYTISNNKNYANYVYEYDESYSMINNYTGNSYQQTYSFVTQATTKYIKVRTIASRTENDLTAKFMLNLGNTALPYEPYGSGKWYKKEFVKKINGNNYTWSFSTTYLQGVSEAIQDIMASQPTDIYCNIATIGIQDEPNKFYVTSGKQLVFRNPYYNGQPITTANDFNNYIKSNLIAYVKLAESTDIEITDTQLIEQLEDIEKMQGYNGTTIITSTFDSNNAQMIISASSLKGE